MRSPGRRRCSCALALMLLATGCRARREQASMVTVLAYSTPTWYEETGRYFQVAPNGRLAIYGSGLRGRLYDLVTAKEDTAGWVGSMDSVRLGAFDASSAIARLGDHAGDYAWFADAGGGLVRVDVPATAFPRWTSRSSRPAYFTPGDPAIVLATPRGSQTVRMDGPVTGLQWTPAGDALYATVLHPNGLSSLERVSSDGAIAIVRPELDAAPAFNSLAFSPDGQTLFLALASESAPDLKTRHDPEAPHRDLDIYALDLASNRLRIVAREPGDDCCPQVGDGSLYWTHNDPVPQVAVFALDGSEPRPVADHGFLPRWSPDGRQIAFTRAYFRLADYGLDMDGWVVGMNADGSASASPRPWIVGYGEDMGPAWSPDGHWVAYHSHRSATPVPLYESPGRTDDTWMMPAAGGPEIRLTDFGFEVGPPDWAPDGRRLVFDSWDKDAPRLAKPWILTIDPSTGRSLGAKRMPLPSGVTGLTGEAWSPKNDAIAFVERIDEARQALWVSHPDGTSAQKLAEFACYTMGGVAWTPDGAQLLYGGLAGDRMQIFAIPAAGGTSRQLTHSGANVMHPSVSPDGRLVAVSQIPWRKELKRIALPR